MALTSLPEVGDDLGPVKEDAAGITTGLTTFIYGAEWNVAAAALEAVCAQVGLADGSTAGSVEKRVRVLERKRAPARIACLGDSFSANNTDENLTPGAGTPLIQYPSNGYLTWANVLLGQRLWFEPSLNFGVGGETAEECLARVDTVIAASPDICVVLAGTNDRTRAQTYAQTVTALQSIYDALIDAGILVVAITVAPRSTWSSLTPEQIEEQRKINFAVNRWIRRYAAVTSGMVLADPFAKVVDQSSATADPHAYMMMSDGLHYGAYGAYVAGAAVAEALSDIIPPRSILPGHKTDVYDATHNPEGNLISNGAMSGSGGSILFPVTGVCADDWTLGVNSGTTGGTIVGSKEARTDGIGGEWQVITLTSYTGPVGQQVVFWATVAGSSGAYAQGDVFEAEAEIQVSGAVKVNSVALRAREYDGANFQAEGLSMYRVGTDDYAPTSWSGIYRTPQVAVKNAVTASSNLRLYVTAFIDGSGTVEGTIKIGRVDLRKVVA